MSTGDVIILEKPLFDKCIYEDSTAITKCDDCWFRFQCKNWRNVRLEQLCFPNKKSDQK